MTTIKGQSSESESKKPSLKATNDPNVESKKKSEFIKSQSIKGPPAVGQSQDAESERNSKSSTDTSQLKGVERIDSKAPPSNAPLLSVEEKRLSNPSPEISENSGSQSPELDPSTQKQDDAKETPQSSVESREVLGGGEAVQEKSSRASVLNGTERKKSAVTPPSPAQDREVAIKGEEASSPPSPKSPAAESSGSEKAPVVSAITREMRAKMTSFQLATALVAEQEEIKEKAKLKENPPVEPPPPPPPPPPEVRALPYVSRPHPKILYKIEREMSVEKFYLMGKRAFGDPHDPESCSFFVIGDIGRRYEVKLRQFPNCQCGDFLEAWLCKHIMFVMLRFFKLKKSDPRIWQRALLASELKALLADPRITPSGPKGTKKTFISKLFPPKVTSPQESRNSLMGKHEKEETELGPQFCPICLEQFNFIAETPEVPYIGPIPYKPKFIPILDMSPPKCIQESLDEKARLQAAMKEHEEEMARARRPSSRRASTKNGEPKPEAPKLEEKVPEGESHKTNKSITKTVADEPDPLPPVRKYETIMFCPNPECKGDDSCYKLVHEWCYRKLDNSGIYPRGKPCPIYSLM